MRKAAINNWISNDQLGTNLSPALNPFDPEQIDLNAVLTSAIGGSNTGDSQTIFGFFFRDYQRIWSENNPASMPNMDDPDNWYWDEIPTPYNFRFRWSPAYEATWNVSVTLTVPGFGVWNLETFQFNSIWNDPNLSFITVAPYNRYLWRASGDMFFPIGQNLLASDLCRCEKRNASDPAGELNENCPTCYNYGDQDPCCGLATEKRHSFWKNPNGNLFERVEPLASFIKMEDQLHTLKNSGANSFRTMMMPLAYDFEFEKLNNYYDRQFMAWELDQLILKSKQLDLRIELCMMIHYQLTHTHSAFWDWTDYDHWGDNFGGSCYYTERDKTGCDAEPASFLSEENAKLYYKKKLRYFIARYGYSASLLDLELISEMNNLGAREGDPNNPDSSWFGWLQTQLPQSRSYNQEAESRYFAGQWQIEMANYIKSDLDHKNHLIGASYTGRPMITGATPFINDGLCSSPTFDRAWEDEAIDIICFSSYDKDKDKYQKMADPNYSNWQWFDLQCPYSSEIVNGGGNQTIYRSGRDYVDKPVMHSETGPGMVNNFDRPTFEKELWVNVFSGFASAGMAWGKQFPDDRWEMFGKVRTFLATEVFALGNFTSSDYWKPGYNLGDGNSDEAEKLEISYLRYAVEDQQMAVGILMNRTWNHGTFPFQDYLDEGAVDSLESWMETYSNLIPFEDISYSHGIAPKVNEMGNCNSFSIHYYDPCTLCEIGTSDDDVILGSGVKLKDFPTLTYSRPYVLFKILRNGGCIMNMPEPNSLNKTDNLQIGELGQGDTQTATFVEENQQKLSIFPNPSTGVFEVVSNSPIDKLELFDTIGSLVPFKFIQKKVVLVNSIPGTYILRVTQGNKIEMKKLIIV